MSVSTPIQMYDSSSPIGLAAGPAVEFVIKTTSIFAVQKRSAGIENWSWRARGLLGVIICFFVVAKFADHVFGVDLLLLGAAVAFVSAMHAPNSKQSEMKEAGAFAGQISNRKRVVGVHACSAYSIA